ncbi:COG3650 family protein [Sagittula stellata]|uniref:Uncharacterized protein n=1 Tax=Sagittula stellata (strain ATCC 700073 / DSM 11524 / E-37) TaxID=388399 RepID=A3KAT2_SAGS3|nr:SH3 domain-containing protein [Sagittula stellata]EBA05728.1 hypothetical protein SSE37_18407 [Sagittula stellata E-37]
MTFWTAVAAVAQDGTLPALHRVTGVAADDVLNVRAGPSAQTEIVGTLAPDATGVGVVRTEGGWGLVNAGERAGWASLRFLEAEPGGTLAEAGALRCFGTEPFWSLKIAPGAEAVLTSPENMDGAAYEVGELRRMPAALEKYLVDGSGPEGAVAAIIQRAACNDGMSDRAFGLDVSVVLSGGDRRVLSGCCTLGD